MEERRLIGIGPSELDARPGPPTDPDVRIYRIRLFGDTDSLRNDHTGWTIRGRGKG